MKSDVIIIGSGLGGLICARLLAERGLRVTVLERHSILGGCLQSYRRHGVSFDTGLHYVGGLAEGHRLHGIFDQLGLMRLPWQRMDPQGFDLITIDGETFPFVEGYKNFANALAGRFPKEREALRKYVELMERADRLPLGAPEVQTLSSVSAYDYLCENFRDELLVNVLAGNALKTELRRESLPLFHFLHATSSFIGGGAWRLKGCGNDIVRTLITDIKAMGGVVIAGAQVDELIESDGQIAAAHCTNGETHRADTFISDIHPQQTFSLVKESKKLSRLFRRRIGILEQTYGMFTVSLVTDRVPYFNHNKYIYKRANVWTPVTVGAASCVYPPSASPSTIAVGADPRVCPQPATVGAAPCVCPQSAPPPMELVDRVMVSCKHPLPTETGKGVVIDLMTPVPLSLFRPWADSRVGHRPDGYLELKHLLADECIALAATAIPDLFESGGKGESESLALGGKVGEAFTSTPLTWRDYTLTPAGSAFGIRKDCRQPLMTILSPRTPISNLLLTGQNLMLHGLEGVTMTALQTCECVVHNP